MPSRRRRVHGGFIAHIAKSALSGQGAALWKKGADLARTGLQSLPTSPVAQSAEELLFLKESLASLREEVAKNSARIEHVENYLAQGSQAGGSKRTQRTKRTKRTKRSRRVQSRPRKSTPQV